MSYNTDKRRMFNLCITMIKKNSGVITKDTLYYEALKRFGIGQLTVNKMIKQLQNMGFVEYNFSKGTLSWVDKRRRKK